MSHQVAQKRAITTLPCVSSARTVPPAGVGRLKAGSCVALAGAVRPAGSGGESAADTVRATEVRSAPSIAVSRDRDVVIGPPVSCLMIRQGAYITKHAPAPRCQRRLLFDVYRCTTVTVHANDVLRRAVTDTLDWAMSGGRRLAPGFKLRRRLFCIVAARDTFGTSDSAFAPPAVARFSVRRVVNPRYASYRLSVRPPSRPTRR